MKVATSEKQQFAIDAAARIIAAADMDFVLIVFDQEGNGALVGDIEPDRALAMVEGLVKAIKERGQLSLRVLDGGETLQ